MNKYKVCSKCHTILLATTDNFHRKKDGKYGLKTKCKKCIAEKDKVYSKAYRETHKEELKAYGKTYREAHKEEIKAYGKAYSKAYYEAHKEEKKARRKTYYEANKEEIKAYGKAYREAHKEKVKTYNKVYSETHKEEIKAYRQSNKGQVVKFNAHNRRRARIASNGGQITPEQWLECMNFFNWQCAYSGEKLTKDNRSLDHIEPVKAGGSNNIWNVVPMTRSLNSSKQDKDMLEWYKQQPFYSEERLQKIYEWIEYSKNKYEEVEVII